MDDFFRKSDAKKVKKNSKKKEKRDDVCEEELDTLGLRFVGDTEESTTTDTVAANSSEEPGREKKLVPRADSCAIPAAGAPKDVWALDNVSEPAVKPKELTLEDTEPYFPGCFRKAAATSFRPSTEPQPSSSVPAVPLSDFATGSFETTEFGKSSEYHSTAWLAERKFSLALSLVLEYSTPASKKAIIVAFGGQKTMYELVGAIMFLIKSRTASKDPFVTLPPSSVFELKHGLHPMAHPDTHLVLDYLMFPNARNLYGVDNDLYLAIEDYGKRGRLSKNVFSALHVQGAHH